METRRYVKKPIPVKAVQMSPKTYYDMIYWPDWLLRATEEQKMSLEGEYWEISTLEGVLKVSKNDWIIQGVEGEIYSCKDSVFQKSYDEVR